MKKYVDKDKLQEFATKLTNKYKTMFSSPLVATTAAEMTDTTKIYVYIGSETGYTSGNWYYYDGTEWQSGGVYNAVAVETDKTLAVADKAADGKATGDAIADVKDDLSEYVANANKSLEYLDGALTECTVLNGTLGNNSNPYCVRTGLIPAKAGTIVKIINPRPKDAETDYYKYGIYFYNAQKTMVSGTDISTGNTTGEFEVIPATTAYVAFHWGEYDGNGNNVTLRKEMYNSYFVGVETKQKELLPDRVDDLEKSADYEWYTQKLSGALYAWENKQISAYTGETATNQYRLKTTYPIKKYVETVSVNSGYWYGIFAYNSGTYVGWYNGSTWTKDTLTWQNKPMSIPHGVSDAYDIYVVAKKDGNNVSISPTDASNILFTSKYVDSSIIENDYIINAEFTKKLLKVDYIGYCTYGQSFCKYNNKYYSTNGSNIGVQTADFEAEQSVSLNVGHGNGFCLGSGNLAYISGWDDDKLYVVDLDTLTLSDTITLPTSGYTTCAVDDVNKLIYIFFRTSQPSTKEYYDFIVYDYDNETIVSTVKIPAKYAAMQACDIYRNRIIAMFGTGTNDKPNGYLVLNTSGEIIGEYVIGSHNTEEPEGVCIDRETQEVLIMYGDRKLYKLT